jgi:VanZ family protein
MLKILRWFPAALMMTIIFLASSTPSSEMPNFGTWDWFFKKGGHMAGYALLSSACWYGFNFETKKGWMAWLLAVVFAASDEFHQSFVPGRHPSPLDVIVFDAGGAALGLVFLTAWFRRHSIMSGLGR